MLFDVEIYNNEEANKFLRALWAEFRKEFGKCAWNYAPHRIGHNRQIRLGTMDIGIPEGVFEVDILYLNKGTIQFISFDFLTQCSNKNRASEIAQIFQTLISASKSKFNQDSKFFFETSIESIYKSLGYYKGKAFKIYSNQENTFNFTIATTGYDSIDAQTQCKSKVLQCLDLLSVETNSSFWLNELINEGKRDTDNEEIFVQDLEWIDDHPVIKGKLRLSEPAKKFLDLVVENKLNETQKLFLNACNHFHTARKYDAQIYDCLKHSNTKEISPGFYRTTFEERDERLSIAAKMGSTHREIASVLYISALEVASSLSIENPKSCPQCGQKVYTIGRRVADMVEKYLGSHLSREFKGYYGKRSKYLHAGELFFNYSYIGTTIPQLDPSDPTGCKVHFSIPLLNLREYTSSCLRKILQSLTVDRVIKNVIPE